jgi:hypothetical protein
VSGAARRALLAPRDQGESAFASILGDLVLRLPGARAAALVDVDGETVDYASRADPFGIKLAAAHWRIVLREAQAALGETCVLSVLAERRSFLVKALPQGYALILALSCGAHAATLGRALPVCVRRLSEEAGWPSPGPLSWHPVEVLSDERGRPRAVESPPDSLGLEILGSVVGGLARCERGWRVRWGRGDATLVREASGHWYADELLPPPAAP